MSAHPFVQVPLDRKPDPPANSPAPRQKKLRVPHGGSAERLSHERSRSAHTTTPPKRVPKTSPSPSLRIVLENEPADEEVPASAEQVRQEEESESLAQFAAHFPKIPSGLIFQFPEEEKEDEPGTDTMPLDAFPFEEDDEITEATDGFSGTSSAAPLEVAHTPRQPTYVNPRYEKMVREAETRSAGHQTTIHAGKMVGRPMQGNQARPAGVSGPLVQDGAFPRNPSVSLPRTEKTDLPHVSQGIPSPQGARMHQKPPYLKGNAAAVTAAWKGGSASSPLASARSMKVPAVSHVTQGNPPSTSVRPLRSFDRTRSVTMPSSFAGNGAPVLTGASSASRTSIPVAPANPTTAVPSLEKTPAAKPLLDAKAIEESTIFDEPPISIAEGMKDADKSHSKGRRALIASLVLIIVALVGVLAFIGTTGSIPVPEFHITTVDNIGKGDSGTSSAAGDGNGTTEGVVELEAVNNGAGSVTYRYTAETSSGVEYTVEEKTTFDDSGNCTFTTMNMQFPTEAAAKEFTDSLARDLGSKYSLDNLNGANATVTVDNSGLGLDRQSYENALRYSVDDLVILKK